MQGKIPIRIFLNMKKKHLQDKKNPTPLTQQRNKTVCKRLFFNMAYRKYNMEKASYSNTVHNLFYVDGPPIYLLVYK